MESYKIPSMARAVTAEDLMGLPRGFRFHPTDEEIVVHYLIPKAMNSSFTAAAIGQADFNSTEPWDLPKIANMGDTERFYYCHRDRKYPTGLRTNRATKAGYWKATGKDKEIYKGVRDQRELVGMKKTLVFYTGRAPAGEKTNWVMHEYRLQPHFSLIPKDDGWVVSRVFHKSGGGGCGGGGVQRRNCSGKRPFSPNQESESFSTDFSLPPLIDPSAVPQPAPDPAPADETQLARDLNPKSALLKSYAYVHPINAYDEDQLIYANDSDYFHASLSESLFKLPGIYGYGQVKEDHHRCKVEQNCGAESSAAVSFSQDLSNDNKNAEVSSDDRFYDELFPSTLGSMLDLSKLWDD